MSSMLRFGACALVLAFAIPAPASAKRWKFEIINKSAAHVTSFRTQEDGKWSKNWLEENVAPGETFDMDFGTDEGDCSVRTRIAFSDKTHVDANIDYCNADKITVRNSGIVWE
ncbi:hypothetical protein [Salinarimonas soli]|uniref:Uncharacterized protein n=1 Tax=Salinarimonas soli TaxID=1638099 RepID=A0A5B2VG17_9HYPH|nr:hypothetical protein [Salinarimonas soli]KAA2237430.1 hypothetical protein F0L46_10570 [Salinarimonas soli]